jgi:hypothetical protein
MSTPAAHLSSEQVADLDEGLLDTADEQAARAHLAGCAQCASHATQLSAVKALLAAEGAAPPAMPAPLAARIDATIAAQRQRSRLPMVLVAAASVAVLGAAVGIGVSTIDDLDVSVAGSAAELDSARPEDNTGRAEDAAGGNGGAGKGGAGSDDDAGPKATGEVGALADLRSEDFDTQVRRQLSSPGAFTDRLPAPSALSPQALSCVRSALEARLPSRPLVYSARLDGRPVQLVLTSPGSTPQSVWAVTCTDPPRVVARTQLPGS